MRSFLLVALAAASTAACSPQPASRSAPASAPPAPAPNATSTAASPAAASASATPTVADDGVPRTVADLPGLIGEGAESRAVNCQVFTVLQAQASTGAEATRYQAAADAWGLRLRAENDGSADAASQTFASFMAPYANQTVTPPPADVIRAAADQCAAAAPAAG